MFNVIKKEIEWAGKKLSFETGKIARQADGAVLARYGDTMVLCTAVAQKEIKEGVDFFPLTVNYQEKTYAAGKIPGGFFKREGRPAEKETLVSRLIDRPLRPLFPENFFNETQVICTVISHDPDADADIVAMVGASAAIAISGIPFNGPIGAARVGFIDGEFVLNPGTSERAVSALDLVVSGTRQSVLMVESEAKVLTEEQMLEAVVFGHQQMQPVIDLIEALKDAAGKPVWTIKEEDNSALQKKIEVLAVEGLREAYAIQSKQARVENVAAVKQKTLDALVVELGEDNVDTRKINKLLKNLEKDIVRGDILQTGKRIDGRGVADVRPIVPEVNILPKTHGSALFTRGETQALVVTTLGTSQDQQLIDGLDGSSKERFMLHYNFPPFSVGEASFLRAPGRREIGHGKLAWRAINPLLPSEEEFPYTLRVVSEITESNGSSSMATVCGTSLALMDAGVPLKASVAGIAMGLIKEGKAFAVLSDILGDEDHLGDMDFKVAGTDEGITALQMDIKIDGITAEIMQVALEQAKQGRKHILGKMAEALSSSRETINENAPQMTTVRINKEKIGALIGPGGKVIKEICDTTGAKIDIEDDGTVRIAAVNMEAINAAKEIVLNIASDPEIGQIYTGKVVSVVDFGAFVAFLGTTEGLVHVSEISSERIPEVSQVLSKGDVVKVKVLGIDRGKVRLSMKRVDQDTGEDISGQFADDDADAHRNKKPSYAQKPQRRKDRGGDRGFENKKKRFF